MKARPDRTAVPRSAGIPFCLSQVLRMRVIPAENTFTTKGPQVSQVVLLERAICRW